MAFHCYQIDESLTGNLLTYRARIKLSGPTGLIARYIKQFSPHEARHGWQLSVEAITRYVRSECEDFVVGAKHVILFDCKSSESGKVRFSMMRKIQGKCDDYKTRLLVELACLPEVLTAQPGNNPKTLLLSHDSETRIYLEQLQLTGGVSGGSWKWNEDSTDIGAALVAGRVIEKTTAVAV